MNTLLKLFFFFQPSLENLVHTQHDSSVYTICLGRGVIKLRYYVSVFILTNGMLFQNVCDICYLLT